MSDAVILVPGIMGSELRSRDGRVLWGMSWSTMVDGRNPLRFHRELEVLPEDLVIDPTQDPRHRRIRASGLLTCAAYFPFWSQEPYTAMAEHLKEHLPDPRAFLAFAYDWRLPVALNAADFAHRARRHLAAWRKASGVSDPHEAQLVIIAHSMGGLVAWQAIQDDAELHSSVRSVVTLGTPFGGSLSSLEVLADHGLAKPPLTTRIAARRLARTCPGVYDLLPRDSCVLDGTPRSLTPADVAAAGGDQTLAQEAIDRRPRLELSHPHRPVAMSVLVGTGQDTTSQVEWDPVRLRFRFDEAQRRSGDGTVVESNALAPGRRAFRIPQTHSGLAASPDGLAFARKRMLGQEVGEPLALPGVNVILDDCQPAGSVSLTVADAASGIAPVITSTPINSLATTRWARQRRHHELRYTAILPPGLHRVTVRQGGFSPLTHLLYVEEE